MMYLVRGRAGRTLPATAAAARAACALILGILMPGAAVAAQWQTLVEVRDNTVSTVVRSFAPVRTARIRLVSTRKSSQTLTNDAARIGEIILSGPHGTIQPISAAASSSYEHGHSADQAIDGVREYADSRDGAKGWASAATPQEQEEWIEVTLPSEQEVSSVVVTTAPAAPYQIRSFRIEAAAATADGQSEPRHDPGVPDFESGPRGMAVGHRYLPPRSEPATPAPARVQGAPNAPD